MEQMTKLETLIQNFEALVTLLGDNIVPELVTAIEDVRACIGAVANENEAYMEQILELRANIQAIQVEEQSIAAQNEGQPNS